MLTDLDKLGPTVKVSVLYALYSSGVTGHLVKLGLDAIGT